MKIVYCCFSGNHASVVAGLIHLNQLPEDRKPTRNELLNCKGFNCDANPPLGKPCLMGRDAAENEIYCLGLGKDPEICLQAICHILEQNANALEWKFIQACQKTNQFTRWGLFCSGKPGLKKIGRLLHILGIQHSYFQLVQQVRQVKEWHQVGKT